MFGANGTKRIRGSNENGLWIDDYDVVGQMVMFTLRKWKFFSIFGDYFYVVDTVQEWLKGSRVDLGKIAGSCWKLWWVCAFCHLACSYSQKVTEIIIWESSLRLGISIFINFYKLLEIEVRFDFWLFFSWTENLFDLPSFWILSVFVGFKKKIPIDI